MNEYSSLLLFHDINNIEINSLPGTNKEFLIEHAAELYFNPDFNYDKYVADYIPDVSTLSPVEINLE